MGRGQLGGESDAGCAMYVDHLCPFSQISIRPSSHSIHPQQQGGTVESWTSLLSMAEQPRPTPPLSATPGSETTPLEPPMSVPLMDMADSYVGAPKETSVQCPRQVIAHDFDESVDRRIWSGGDGDAIHHTSDGKIVLHPHLSWQGFKVDFT